LLFSKTSTSVLVAQSTWLTVTNLIDTSSDIETLLYLKGKLQTCTYYKHCHLPKFVSLPIITDITQMLNISFSSLWVLKSYVTNAFHLPPKLDGDNYLLKITLVTYIPVHMYNQATLFISKGANKYTKYFNKTRFISLHWKAREKKSNLLMFLWYINDRFMRT
jgi:hypothetical protein